MRTQLRAWRRSVLMFVAALGGCTAVSLALLRKPMCGLKLSIKVWYRHCCWKLLSVRPSCTCFSVIPRIRFRQASFFIFLNSTDSLGLSWLPRALLDTLLTIASQCRQ